MDPPDFPLYAGEFEAANTETLSYLRPIIVEMMEHLDASEITVTFKQKWCDSFDNDEILSMFQRYFRFLPLNNLKEILLVPEYGANKNLHFHGIIRGRAKELSSLKGFLNKRFGRSTISMIRSHEDYARYLQKEQDHTDIEDIIHYKYD